MKMICTAKTSNSHTSQLAKEVTCQKQYVDRDSPCVTKWPQREKKKLQVVKA